MRGGVGGSKQPPWSMAVYEYRTGFLLISHFAGDEVGAFVTGDEGFEPITKSMFGNPS